jgi:hypothetical protein
MDLRMKQRLCMQFPAAATMSRSDVGVNLAGGTEVKAYKKHQDSNSRGEKKNSSSGNLQQDISLKLALISINNT